MAVANLVLSYVKALIWPSIVLILSTVFRRELRGLFGRVSSVEAGGASVEDVLMFRVYLTRREDFAAMNDAYAEFVVRHVPSGIPPARTTVFTGLPHAEMLVEIDALAVTD